MSTTVFAPRRLTLPLATLSWALQLATAAMFLMAGSAKLTGDPMMVGLFDVVGGQWFRYVTGTIEVAGALALLVPVAAPFAAIVLSAVMVGAIFTHLFLVGGSFLVPVLLLAALVGIAVIRRDRLTALRG